MGKRLHKMVVFVAFIFSATISHAEETGQCKDWVAKVAAVSGKIDAKRHGQQDWLPVQRNNTYCAGDQIRAAKASSATLVFTNETLVTLDELTAITINQIEDDGPSLIELIKGIAHFISRVPRSLKVNTPFVNAAIEGTEFVVEVGDNETNVTVFEGTVLTANDQGELRITNNETSKTLKGQAPQKVLLARPRDAVQWALYFPPIIKSDEHGNVLQRASALLYNGRVDEARELLTGDSRGEAKALLAIIAIVTNQDNAFTLANEAVQLAPDSAASHIALSYAWQSHLDLNQALASANTATAKEVDNAIAWARLAELQLSVGKLANAQDSAQKASELDATLARAQTILGYAYLTQIKIDKADSTFNKAIELDQNDPLPHLGLGLAMIRKNELAAGRREIEIAAALDPNNAIIRSYLGKAYYEEKRGPLDADQFAMAKELDPNDPTPYFYDAIRKQTENNPAGALEDINKSIELNDHRAVYRSSLQLDQDEAARSASLARVYQDLGFEQLAINEASKSLAQDPGNHSAHRFLSESYQNIDRHEIASVSEGLQAKLLQPSNNTPNLASSIDGKVNTLQSNLNLNNSLNEYSSLFIRDGVNLVGNFLAGSNNTISDELALFGTSGPLSYNLSQYYYSTDGYRENNDLKYNIYNVFLQYQASFKHNFQFEVTSRNSEYGDIAQRIDPANFSTVNRRKVKTDSVRLGYNYKVNQSSNFIASFIYNNEKDNARKVNVSGITETDTDSELNDDGLLGEIQYLLISEKINTLFGIGHFSDNQNIHTDVVISVGGIPLPPPFSGPIDIRDNVHHTNTYLYLNYKPNRQSSITVGGSYDNYNSNEINEEQFNPKFGFLFQPIKNLSFRGAYFEVLRRSLFRDQTVEPSNISGFNQFYDEVAATQSENIGLGFDYQTNTFSFGANAVTRDLISPRISITDDTRKENIYKSYIYWAPFKTLTMSFEYISDDFRSDRVPPTTLEIDRLKTNTTPIGITYRPFKVMNLKLINTHVSQESAVDDAVTKTDFSVLDFHFKYHLTQNSSVSFIVKNLLDNNFSYQDRNFLLNEHHSPLYIPEINYYANLDFNF